MDTRVAHITLESCGNRSTRTYRVIKIQNSVEFDIGEMMTDGELRDLKRETDVEFTIKPSRSS